MNIAYFLKPKAEIAFIYDTCTFRQALEKMKYHGFTAIPVISENGRYIGTVSEGDFLWNIINGEQGKLSVADVKNLETLKVGDIINREKYPPVHITSGIDEFVIKAMGQNFLPVVDDRGSFIGIITRRDIIKHFYESYQTANV